MSNVTRGSGNVFSDVGLPASMLAKAKLTARIAQAIEARRYTQQQAAEILGLAQPKISMLLRGRFEGFSIERLVRLLNALGRDVTISVKPHARGGGQGTVRVA